jgi:5-methylcytosine-specific restriction endonuclease McrA
MKRNYEDQQYTQWRKQVRRRDHNRCRMPGCGCKLKLQVHHIRPWSTSPSLRYEVSNGITLCKQCHSEVTRHEHVYIKLFEELVTYDEKLLRNKRHKRKKRL